MRTRTKPQNQDGFYLNNRGEVDGNDARNVRLALKRQKFRFRLDKFNRRVAFDHMDAEGKVQLIRRFDPHTRMDDKFIETLARRVSYEGVFAKGDFVLTVAIEIAYENAFNSEYDSYIANTTFTESPKFKRDEYGIPRGYNNDDGKHNLHVALKCMGAVLHVNERLQLCIKGVPGIGPILTTGNIWEDNEPELRRLRDAIKENFGFDPKDVVYGYWRDRVRP